MYLSIDISCDVCMLLVQSGSLVARRLYGSHTADAEVGMSRNTTKTTDQDTKSRLMFIIKFY